MQFSKVVLVAVILIGLVALSGTVAPQTNHQEDCNPNPEIEYGSQAGQIGSYPNPAMIGPCGETVSID